MSLAVLFGFLVSVIGRMVCSSHPIRAGLGLLGASLGVAGVVGCSCSSWLGFLVVLAYSGGMLVIFSYVCCFASDCTYYRVRLLKFIVLVVLCVVAVVVLYLGMGPRIFLLHDLWSDIDSCEGGKLFVGRSLGWVLFIFGYVLTVVMVVVVKLCGPKGGSLRPFKRKI